MAGLSVVKIIIFYLLHDTICHSGTAINLLGIDAKCCLHSHSFVVAFIIVNHIIIKLI